MKKISTLIFCWFVFVLNGMDKPSSSDGISPKKQVPADCVAAKSFNSDWRLIAPLCGVNVAVVKGNVCNADGLADLIVGSVSSFNGKKISSSREVILSSCIRYGRYGFDYQKRCHMEGAIIVPNACAWMSNRCLDRTVINVEKDRKKVKQCLYDIYEKALYGMKKKFPRAKCIALSSLGTEAGFPASMTISVAVKAVCNFIKQNPGAYSRIILFTKKQPHVDHYVELFEKNIN